MEKQIVRRLASSLSFAIEAQKPNRQQLLPVQRRATHTGDCTRFRASEHSGAVSCVAW